MLDSKLLKPRKGTNNCTLIVKGDWNDADYITEDTSWNLDEMKEALPYFSIMLDLFKYDYNYRHKTQDYRVDIRADFNKALDFYLEHEENFYKKLQKLKKNKEILSDRLISLDKDNFEDVHEAALQNLREYLQDNYSYVLPSYEGWGIHNIIDMYIDYKGNKYDVLPGKALEAFAEIMDIEYDNFAWTEDE